MRKFTKICLVVAGVTCAMGIGTLISSIAMGATINDLQTAINRGDYVLMGGSKASRAEESHEDYTDWEDEYDYEDDYEDHDDDNEYTSDRGTYKDITKLDVEMASGGFYIEESETDKISVEVSDFKGKKTKVTQKGNELKISNNYKFPYKGSVTLYCPADTKFDEVDIHVDGGEAVINVPLEAKEIDVEIGAGLFEANESITANETDWQVGAGELVVSRLTSVKSDFECGAGSIEASFTGSKTDYNYELECSLGEIILGDETYSGLGKEMKVNNNAKQEIKAECSVGGITVDFEE